MPMIACPKCDALNKQGTEACVECGAAFAEAAWPEPEKAKPARPSKDEARERSRARQEFARLKKTVLTVRSVYWAGAVLAIVNVLLSYTVYNVKLPDDTQWLVTAIQIVMWAQLALMITGGLLVLRSPFIWSAVGASFWTLQAGLILLSSDFKPTPFGLVFVFMAIAFWFAVGQAARVERLMAEHEDLQIVRKKIDPSRKVQGGVADHARERRRRERRQSSGSRWRMVGFVAGGLALLGGGVWAATRPPSVDATLEAFVSRWEKADADALGFLLPDGPSSRAHNTLVKDLGQRGWLANMPKLGAPTMNADADKPDYLERAVFSCDGRDLEVTFRRYEKKGWKLIDIDLPELKVKDLQQGIQEFQDAWKSTGPAALIQMFRPESRARAGASLERSLQKRGWTDSRPKLENVHVTRGSGARRRVQFDIDLDQVSLSLEYWHPSWRIVGIRLPKL